MEFSIKVSAPEKQPSACVVVGVFESRKLSPAAEQIDKASKGQVRALLRAGDMEGKLRSTRMLYRVPGVSAERVLLVGLGAEKELRDRDFG